MVCSVGLGDCRSSYNSVHGFHVASFVPTLPSAAPLRESYVAINLRPSSSRMLTVPVSRRRRITSTSLAAAEGASTGAGAAGTPGAANSVEGVQQPVTPAPTITYGEGEIQSAIPPIAKKAPASARLALDDARKLVRERRQQAKDRQAATAAAAAAAGAPAAVSNPSDKPPPNSSVDISSGLFAASEAATLEPGGGPTTPVDDASTFSKASTSQSQPPPQSGFNSSSSGSSNAAASKNTNTPPTPTRGFSYPRKPRDRIGRGGAGAAKRGRVLPDFTGIAVARAMAGPMGDAVAATSGGGPTNFLGQGGVGEEGQSGDDAALVASIKATLANTEAQLGQRAPRARVGGVAAEVGVVAGDQGGAANERGGVLPPHASRGAQQVRYI